MERDDLRYHEDHGWVRADEHHQTAVIGISDFAQRELGEVLYINLPEAGATLTAGEPYGEIESTKTVSDLIAPLSGTVRGRNDAVLDRPELVNESPLDEGWLLDIALSNQSELDGLMDAVSYQQRYPES